MRKLLALVVILLLFAGLFSVSAEGELTTELISTLVGIMETDFELLLDGLGTDIDTILVQNAMSGQNIGMAEFGDEKFNNFYIGIPITATVANGFLNFRNKEDYFQLLDLNSMLDDLAITELEELVEGTVFEGVLDNALNNAFPIPAVKLSLGFALPGDLEILMNGMFVPKSVTETLLEDTEAGAELSFGYTNIGGVVRYVLLRDTKGLPGLSIGAGAYYNNFGLSLGMEDILSEMLTTEEENDDTFEGANMTIGTNALTFGLDFAISKKLLGFFIPYAKIGAWYGITNVGGSAVLIADDSDTEDDEEVAVESSIGSNGFDILLDAGFDILLGPVGINLGGNYNLGSGVWGVSIGSRLQL